MEYTLSGAAKATGRGKSTLHRAIKSGKLSARRTEEGSYLIDASELARAFPVEPPEPSPWNTSVQNDHVPKQPEVELAVLRVRVEMLEEQLAHERETHRETLDDLRKRLDQEQEERRNLQRQLTSPIHAVRQAAQQPIETAVKVESAKPYRRFLARFFGRTAVQPGT